ncbi:hypothetical protein GF337_09815, partial [candidate division KSB1 bacterium]|nr:hypothetical protein [candidate division KSB1 bacterium]
MEFRSCISEEKNQGDLEQITEKVSPDRKATHIINRFEPKSVLLENV